MKAKTYLLIGSLTGLLTLTACQTQAPAHAHSGGDWPAQGQTQTPTATHDAAASYLVTLAATAPSMVTMGEQFEYDLAVTAKGDVAEVTVVSTLPDGATFMSSEPQARPDGKRLVWRLGTMNKDETKVVKVTLKADKQTSLAACATVSALPYACVITMVGRPQLVIKKTGPEMAMLGQDVPYTIVVQNTGTTTAKDVVVTDTVPDGLSSANGQRELTFNVGDLAASASKSISVPLKAEKRGKVVNKAFAAASQTGKVEAEAATTIVQAGVKIEKSTKDKEIFMNRAATYDIVISNTGDTELTGVAVTDTVAAETVIATAEGATVSGTTATWNVGELKPGEKKNFTVKVLSKVAGRFTDTATVTTTQGLKDTAQDFTDWKGVTGLLVEVLDNPDPIQVGETSQYTVRVTNQGSAMSIMGLGIVATVPDELELVPNTVSDGGEVSGKTITWPVIATVAPKASVTRTYIAKGIKVGDARSVVSITTTQRKQPIVQQESTTVY